jgi:hypothetical protein
MRMWRRAYSSGGRVREVRGIAWVLAGVCAALMVLLLFKSPTADFEPAAGGSGTVSVECSPVIRVGWPSDFSGLQPEDRWDHFSDHANVVNGIALREGEWASVDIEERKVPSEAELSTPRITRSKPLPCTSPCRCPRPRQPPNAAGACLQRGIRRRN